MVDTSYAPGGGGETAVPNSPAEPVTGGRSLARLKQDYLAYLSGKTAEINEQQEGRRYYHGSQYTSKQIKTLNDRKQPIVTYNRIARKINAVVGLLERQRQDPRGYPRTPKHEQGAEVATAVLRYVLDEQEWKAKSPIVGLNGAIDGIGGIEIIIEEGDHGDREIGFETVDPSGFFYDPRSMLPDFSDASFMGVGKWADQDELLATFPDKAAEIKASADQGSELTSNPDSDTKWISGDANNRRIRVVDEWYKKGNDWYYCIFTGSAVLAEGKSFLLDEKRHSICKYIMFSANVDHDGDRYGFGRNMKSPQDEINQRRSKGLHLLNSRRMKVEDGNGLDVEKARKEAARPDGVIVYPHGTTAPDFDDGAKAAELTGHLQFLQEAKEEIENYGFNPALMGSGVQDMSGRAIALQQQAGIAELGPYLLGYKGWKLRVYRAIWCAVQEHWTSERWIRVTDDDQVAQFFAVNQLGIDPQTGMPAIVNQIGSLDVDIILDEGPDAVNLEADMNETLKQILPAVASQLTPQMAQAAVEMLINTSALPASAKMAFKEAAKAQPQPNPVQQQGVMLELQAKDLANKKTESEIMVNRSKAMSAAPPTGADPAEIELEKWKALLSSFTSIEIAKIGAGTDVDSAQVNAKIEAFLGLSGLANDQQMQLRDHAHQQMMLAMQPPPAQSAAA